MPASVAPTDTRSRQPLAALFWTGVALAPVAVLILLVADSNGPLRIAAVLAIVAVVLIGLSIALRTDGAGPDRSEELLDEIAQLRRELRGEIVAAAQRGNEALDHAQRAREEAAALRRRLDATSAALAGAEAQAGAGRARVPVGDAAVGRVPGQDDGAPRRRSADRDEEEHVRRPQPAPRAERSAPGPAGGYASVGPTGGYGPDQPAVGEPAGAYGAGRPAEQGGPPGRPLGVVRHTETVHVTTRHTVVDGSGPVPGDRGASYDGDHPGRWSPVPQERQWPAEPADRERAGRRGERGQQWDEPGDAGGPDWVAPVGQPGRGRSYQPEEAGPGGEYWPQLRAGDRWAAVRDDDRGRELRVGERRAEVHADAAGTEYRVEDRWAVRRDEPRRDRTDDGWRGGWSEPDDVPALPAGGVPVPDEWSPPRQRGHRAAAQHDAHQFEAHQFEAHEPEAYHARRAEPGPERYGRRREERHGHPPQDDAPRAGGARSADRWR
ncbi:hypothetical protein [Micromonospora sp. KLBMP9576]|uniref:hypothetical protein n=1 Tax=Micromonospora sp. KLBMP9576 TaxID=3424769 RepID=UPI003D93FF5A